MLARFLGLNVYGNNMETIAPNSCINIEPPIADHIPCRVELRGFGVCFPSLVTITMQPLWNRAQPTVRTAPLDST
jgi:hypothetical protein